LTRFHGARVQAPVVKGEPMDLALLYREVCQRGGLYQVCADKKMRQVANALGIPSSVTAASNLLKVKYENILLAYEERFYHRRTMPWQMARSDAGGAGAELRPPGGDATARLGAASAPARVGAMSSPASLAEMAAPAPAVGWNLGTEQAPLSRRAAPIGSSPKKRRRIVVDGNLPVASTGVAGEPILRQGATNASAEAACIVESIDEDIGPYLSITSSIDELTRGLKTRHPDLVAASLNALGVVSRRPALPLQPTEELLDELLGIVAEGLQEAPPGRRALAEVEALSPGGLAGTPSVSAERQEERRGGGAPVPWWEAEGALTADPGDDFFAWAVCAMQIVRNVALTPNSTPSLAKPLAAALDCIEYHEAEQTVGSDELAFNSFSLLRGVGTRLRLPEAGVHATARLFGSLVKGMQDPASSVRTRTEAAFALKSIADNSSSHEAIAACNSPGSAPLVGAVADLLHLPLALFMREVDSGRDSRGPGAGEAHITYLSKHSQDAVALRMWGEAQWAALSALASLCKIEVGQVREAVAASGVLPAVVRTILVQPPSMPFVMMRLLDEEWLDHSHPCIKNGYHALLSKGRNSAKYTIARLASMDQIPHQLRVLEGSLEEEAVCNEFDAAVAEILALLSR